MNKTLVKSALTFTTRSFQTKSICRAINYLAKPYEDILNEGTVVKLNLYDLKRIWFIQLVGCEFKPTKSKLDDIEMRTDFSSLLQCRNGSDISRLLKNGNILILGDKHVCDKLGQMLLNIPQERIDTFFKKFKDFFTKKDKDVSALKITIPDLENISLRDVKTNDDIDFIRDEALRIENTDIHTALRLMELAHQARPDGPFIKKKVFEYRAKVKDHS